METRYRRQQRYALTTTRFFGAEGPARVPTQRVSPFAERARGNVTDAVTANCSSISLPRLAYTHSSVIGTAILPTRLQLAVCNHHDQLRYTSFLAPSPFRSSLDTCKTSATWLAASETGRLPHDVPPRSAATHYPTRLLLASSVDRCNAHLVASLSRYPSQTSAGFIGCFCDLPTANPLRPRICTLSDRPQDRP